MELEVCLSYCFQRLGTLFADYKQIEIDS